MHISFFSNWRILISYVLREWLNLFLYRKFTRYTFQMKLFWKFCLCSPVQVLVSGQSPASADDIYLDDQQSGDYPLDDDDFTSGSGSGKDCLYDSKISHFITVAILRHLCSQETLIMILWLLTPNTKCCILTHNSFHTICKWSFLIMWLFEEMCVVTFGPKWSGLYFPKALIENVPMQILLMLLLLCEVCFIQDYTNGNGQWTFFCPQHWYFACVYPPSPQFGDVMPLLLCSSLLWTLLKPTMTNGAPSGLLDTTDTSTWPTTCVIWNRTVETCGKSLSPWSK